MGVATGGTVTFDPSLAGQTIILTTTEIVVSTANITIDGISTATEHAILEELERLGVLILCETCGQCDLDGARCIVTARGNGICGKSAGKR